MSIQTEKMVNENYEPSANDEKVLDALKDGRSDSQPWGRANPRYLIDETNMEKGNVEFSLRSLRDAGWIERVARGLYELNEDPREGVSSGENLLEGVQAELENIEAAFERGDPDTARTALKRAQDAISDDNTDGSD
ncbi:type IV toxin-antitoxin system AbiEi family antitoxin domain-containing protein [Natrinema hispanicum]|uniref:Transcriptional regulator n=1 Tax=Natrinema hispanicum TaxID=392421 RepID=A0A1I0IXC9_9EURY|nr:type IV toxin-antitoxin system AbiEi family antitoxin domain-containing protein [Natrinema hispanicum]SEU01333.1 hypothetical protein SAMN04488694_12649 [Natrinema hispanicum]